MPTAIVPPSVGSHSVHGSLCPSDRTSHSLSLVETADRGPATSSSVCLSTHLLFLSFNLTCSTYCSLPIIRRRTTTPFSVTNRLRHHATLRHFSLSPPSCSAKRPRLRLGPAESTLEPCPRTHTHQLCALTSPPFSPSCPFGSTPTTHSIPPGSRHLFSSHQLYLPSLRPSPLLLSL